MPKVVEVRIHKGIRYELRDTWCGKSNCTKCPHGPYWYAIVQIQGAKTITRYVGKTLRVSE